MPYRTIYTDAETFLTHREVIVYHVYEDNDVDGVAKTHSYCLQPDSDVYSDGFPHFNVTDLPNWVPDPHPPYINHRKDDQDVQEKKQQAWNEYWQQGGELAHIRKILSEAIDLGYVTQTSVTTNELQLAG